ncbi:MAG: SPFH domain-containing protein [Planctomycetota bacterium]|nr:SPFH domain-containing protein [Planctomycetota bacterium]
MNFTKVLMGIAALMLLGWIGFALLFERVPPTMIGVKQVQWSGGGIIEEDFGTGFHLGISGYHKWYLLDRRTQFLTFSDDGDREGGAMQPALKIITSDNNRVSVDLTVSYRIKPGEANQLVVSGLRGVYRERVTSTVTDVMRAQLAQLTSEQLYSTVTRLERSKATLPVLREALAELFIEPDVILLRAVRFPPEYEERLQTKQLTYQTKLLANAQQAVEAELQETGTSEKEIEAAEKELRGTWDKQLQEVQSENLVQISEIYGDAEKYDRTTRAEADADFETMLAEGGLAIDKAEALRNSLRNQALDTAGGAIYLAKQAAENLDIREVTLNSNDPRVPTVLDLGELVDLLIGSEEQ